MSKQNINARQASVSQNTRMMGVFVDQMGQLRSAGDNRGLSLSYGSINSQ